MDIKNKNELKRRIDLFLHDFTPEVVCKCTLHFGKGNPEWGAEPDALYYVLKIEKVEEVRNHVLLG